MTHDLLIEIGTEDLPARYVKPLAEALSAGIQDGLDKQGITRGAAKSFATPRRIAVLIKAVAGRQPDQAVDRLGPAVATAFKDGKPTPAALGFAKSCGVELASLGEKRGKLHYSSTVPGRATQAFVPEIFADTLKRMDELVPKRMRWGEGEETFVRPVQWIVALFGAKVVPLERFGLKSGNKTYGHRFHAPKAIVLKSPAEYEKRLKAAKVWADFASRRTAIWKGIESEARKLKGVPHANDALLDEVTALVEWPVMLHGRMEERFMQLPPEVVIATIEHNQRYFPVFSPTGKLLPAFIAVSNIESRDKTQIVIGNERVVRPRLSDAHFFWDEDRKKPVSGYLESLEKVTFQQKLGSIAEKTKRIVAISSKIATTSKLDADIVRQAAQHCKADLVTRMVFEFPELQGIMGGYYAMGWCGNETVSAAIREHYQPIHAGASIPSTPVGQALALADKLDTLAGIFSIGLKPTASKDPYALRRAALGVLRILIEGELDHDLRALLATAVALQPGVKEADALVEALLQFHWDRLRSYYLDAGVAVEIFESVIATGRTRPLDLDRRIRAMQSFVRLPEAEKLAAAHKRIRNILRQARTRGDASSAKVDRSLAEPVEQKLIDAVQKVQGTQPGIFRFERGVALNEAGAAQDHYLKALKSLAALQAPVDQFFNDVMVMAEDPAVRANRLALLSELDILCRAVADLSCLPG